MLLLRKFKLPRLDNTDTVSVTESMASNDATITDDCVAMMALIGETSSSEDSYALRQSGKHLIIECEGQSPMYMGSRKPSPADGYHTVYFTPKKPKNGSFASVFDFFLKEPHKISNLHSGVITDATQKELDKRGITREELESIMTCIVSTLQKAFS